VAQLDAGGDMSVPAFVDEHWADLMRLAVALCRDHVAAEDLVQDCLERLLSRWGRVQSADSPLAYAKQSLVRLFIDQTRRRRVRLVELGESDGRSSDGGISVVDGYLTALAMLRQLPPRERAVLALRYIECMDDASIAHTLRITRSTVRTTAHHALRKLSVGTDTELEAAR